MKIVAPDIEVYEKCGDEVIEPFYFSEPIESQTCDSLIHHSKEIAVYVLVGLMDELLMVVF